MNCLPGFKAIVKGEKWRKLHEWKNQRYFSGEEAQIETVGGLLHELPPNLRLEIYKQPRGKIMLKCKLG